MAVYVDDVRFLMEQYVLILKDLLMMEHRVLDQGTVCVMGCLLSLEKFVLSLINSVLH